MTVINNQRLIAVVIKLIILMPGFENILLFYLGNVI